MRNMVIGAGRPGDIITGLLSVRKYVKKRVEEVKKRYCYPKE